MVVQTGWQTNGRVPTSNSPMDDQTSAEQTFPFYIGGAEGDRTPDLYNAIVALSQLSYGPRTPLFWS